ncbi:MAG: VPLPA-CTERM sorting domain-containing protein [Pseudomonadota bacterium]
MKKTLISAVLAAFAAPAFAATVTVSGFSAPSYDTAVGSMGSAVTQNFESFSEGNVAGSFATNVGTFSSLGEQGSGATVNGAGFVNDGTRLAIRDGNVFGRVSTTPTLSGNAADNLFLDSNDTHGIVWHVMLAGQRMFDRLVFTITDAAEFGNTLRITTDHGTTNVASAGGSLQRLVEIDFGQQVSEAKITLGHFRGDTPSTNDGFSIDDIAVSEVPLPASALLLLGGLGGLAALRRRKAGA